MMSFLKLSGLWASIFVASYHHKMKRVEQNEIKCFIRNWGYINHVERRGKRTSQTQNESNFLQKFFIQQLQAFFGFSFAAEFFLSQTTKLLSLSLPPWTENTKIYNNNPTEMNGTYFDHESTLKLENLALWFILRLKISYRRCNWITNW